MLQLSLVFNLPKIVNLAEKKITYTSFYFHPSLSQFWKKVLLIGSSEHQIYLKILGCYQGKEKQILLSYKARSFLKIFGNPLGHFSILLEN